VVNQIQTQKFPAVGGRSRQVEEVINGGSKNARWHDDGHKNLSSTELKKTADVAKWVKVARKQRNPAVRSHQIYQGDCREQWRHGSETSKDHENPLNIKNLWILRNQGDHLKTENAWH